MFDIARFLKKKLSKVAQQSLRIGNAVLETQNSKNFRRGQAPGPPSDVSSL